MACTSVRVACACIAKRVYRSKSEVKSKLTTGYLTKQASRVLTVSKIWVQFAWMVEDSPVLGLDSDGIQIHLKIQNN